LTGLFTKNERCVPVRDWLARMPATHGFHNSPAEHFSGTARHACFSFHHRRVHEHEERAKVEWQLHSLRDKLRIHEYPCAAFIGEANESS
jgi:hypothetical protein